MLCVWGIDSVKLLCGSGMGVVVATPAVVCVVAAADGVSAGCSSIGDWASKA